MERLFEISASDIEKVSGGDLYNPHFNESPSDLIRELQAPIRPAGDPSIEPVVWVP